MSFLPIDRRTLLAVGASKVRGVRLAIVVDHKDGHGNPGYRVKLKFPWLNEQETSFWARIAVPMAGSDRGTYVLPEIDDQVLVVFEHGEFDRPIVIGSVWSKKQEPVEVNQSGKNNTKLIKSRAGHRIIFDDQDGAESITIVDATGKNKIVLDSAGKVVKIESDGDIEVIAKTNVIVHASALKIGATEGVTGQGRLVLAHAKKTFGIKAASRIAIGGGSTTINVTNAAATSVSGTGSGAVGGAPPEQPKRSAAPSSDGSGSSDAHGSTAAGDREPDGSSSPGAGMRGAGDSPSMPSEVEDDQIEVQVVNALGTPQASVAFELTFPDGTTRTGMTAADGFIRFSGLTQRGNCQLRFKDLR
jgi:phage baseplate assembly protein gpV